MNKDERMNKIKKEDDEDNGLFLMEENLPFLFSHYANSNG